MCNSTMAGPDFLDSMASAARAQGQDVNADAFDQRAREWRETEARVQQLELENTQLDRANSSLRRQLEDARKACEVQA